MTLNRGKVGRTATAKQRGTERSPVDDKECTLHQLPGSGFSS